MPLRLISPAPVCHLEKAVQVAIVQRRLTHYRVPLFARLRSELGAAGLRLMLVHGQAAPDESDKRDGGELAWALRIRNRYVRAGPKYLCWQPLPAAARYADLVIVTQENSLLSNYPLLLRRRPGQRVAFWGHGANLQSRSDGNLRERFKRWTTNRVDWWFAYTRSSADLVRRAGFPPDRITVLNNAVDTAELQRLRDEIAPAETQRLRESLAFDGALVGAFIGSLYAEKRLDFLLEAAKRIRFALPDFRLLVIGDGPERDRIIGWTREHPWVRWAGALSGRAKVAYLSTAQVMLNPGAVGLTMLDSFALGLPLATTDCGIHGPEISYLESGVNGLMTADDIEAYACAVAELLGATSQRMKLRDECLAGAGKYCIEDMTQRFVAGVLMALAAPQLGSVEALA